MDIFEQLAKETQRATDFIAEKAILAKDYTVASWSAAELRNKIDRHYKKLGELTYQSQRQEKDFSEAIAAEISELDALYTALREREHEKQNLCGKKSCPSCAKSVAKEHPFCPYCGASLK